MQDLPRNFKINTENQGGANVWSKKKEVPKTRV